MKKLGNFILATGIAALSFLSASGQEPITRTNTYGDSGPKHTLGIYSGEKVWLDKDVRRSYKLTPFVRAQYERKITNHLSLELGVDYISKVKSDPFKIGVQKIFEYNTIKALQGNFGVKGYFSVSPKKGFTPYGRIGVEQIKGWRETGEKDPLALSRIRNIKHDLINSTSFYFGGGVEINKKHFGVHAGFTGHEADDGEISSFDVEAGIKIRL